MFGMELAKIALVNPIRVQERLPNNRLRIALGERTIICDCRGLLPYQRGVSWACKEEYIVECGGSIVQDQHRVGATGVVHPPEL